MVLKCICVEFEKEYGGKISRYEAIHVMNHPSGPYIVFRGYDDHVDEFMRILGRVAGISGGKIEHLDGEPRVNKTSKGL